MTMHAFSTVLLVLAVVIGCWRSWRMQAPLLGLRCAVQIALALALWLCLWPPSGSESFTRDELVVLTPGASAQQIATARGTLVALPGVDAPRTIEHAPDLATALRHHADARRLRVVGGGLPLRDQDAARGRLVAFDAASLPRGIVELEWPTSVSAGAQWRLRGRVEGLANGRVELRDPADQVIATLQPDVRGEFTAFASVKGAGAMRFGLRALDAQGVLVDQLELPIVAEAGTPLRLLLLADAPDAQLKYLRRWAQDAGITLDSRIGLSKDVVLREGSAQVDAATLAQTDLVVIDERAWEQLDTTRKDALRSALREGLGLLLRVTGTVPERVAQDWQTLGISLEPDTATTPIHLDRAAGLVDSRLDFSRLPITLTGSNAAPLLRADDGSVLAIRRNVGDGRVGVMRIVDEWRIALAGHRAAYASLWSGLVAQLARARAPSAPQLPHWLRVGERALLCGVQSGDVIETIAQPTAKPVGLFATGKDQCAAWWPAQSGWHALVRGAQRWPLYVQEAAAASALAQAERTRQTRALMAAAGTAEVQAQRERLWPRWPFLLAVIGFASLLWWLERRVREAQSHPRN